MESEAATGEREGLNRHCKAGNVEQRCPGQALYEAGAAPWQLRADQGSPDEVGDALSHSRSYIPIFHSQADFHRPVFRTAAPANAEDITQQLLELERDVLEGFYQEKISSSSAAETETHQN